MDINQTYWGNRFTMRQAFWAANPQRFLELCGHTCKARTVSMVVDFPSAYLLLGSGVGGKMSLSRLGFGLENTRE